MIPPEDVKELVAAHSRLREPTAAAIWIKRDAPEAWLVEVIPTMADDDSAHEPIFFAPGVGFRFPVALIVGNASSLERAVRARTDLAREIAAGLVLLDRGPGEELRRLAAELTRAA